MQTQKIALIALLVCFFVFSLPAGTCLAYSGGDGLSESTAFQIATTDDLMELAGDTGNYDKYFILTANIDLGSYSFTTAVIAPDTDNSTWDHQGPKFGGHFDGDGHTISNLTIDTIGAGNDFLGLFGYISGGEIKNLTLNNVSITGGDDSYYLGGLVGRNGGSISSCSSKVAVSGATAVGGLVGNNESGIINDCFSTGTVQGENYLGGLVGYNYNGNISNSNSTGVLSGGADSYYLGGLVGYNNGSIGSSSSNSTVSGGDNSYNLGGLVGSNIGGGTISSCSSTGNIDGGDSSFNIGGLAGRNDNSVIDKCYSTGDVSSSGGDSYNIGGLVGDNGSGTGTITNCYSTGNAYGGTGASQNVGGLVGYNAYNINYCYSTGFVSAGAGSQNLGGLVGNNNGGMVTASFWDMDTSGQTTSAGGTGLSTTDMMKQSTFTDAGWDFVGETANGTNDIWAICEDATYPQLRLSTYSGGSGTVCDPYQIANACDLLALGATLRDYDKYFILTADIDLGPSGAFTTAVIARDIDNSNYNFDGVEFIGHFNGDGHKISNLTINTGGAGNDYLGLFGSIGYGAEIKNLRLENVSIISITSIASGAFSVYLGGMSGQNNGSISNCSLVGDIRCEGGGVSQYGAFGGLTGWNNDSGSISKCFTTGTVTGGDGSIYIGGLAGASNGSISNCYSTDVVTGGNDSEYLGGLVGDNSSSISDCYSTGAVTGGDNSSNLGGLVGYNDGGSISNCYSTGAVSYGAGSSDYGGLVGYNDGAVTACFWDTTTSGQTDSAGGTGLPTVDMMKQDTFTNAGWDFVGETTNGTDDIWYICEGVEYPKFIWQYVPLSPPTYVLPSNGTFTDHIQVTWDSVPDATAYEIWHSNVNESASAEKAGETALLTYDDYDVTPGMTIYYWIVAKNSCDTSDFSASNSGYACPIPWAPTGVSATDGTYTGYIQVTWNAVSGASAYEVLRNTSNNSGTASSLGDRTSPFNDSGVTPGATYYYWVKAKNSCGNISEFSTPDSGYACPIPSAPSGVSATDGTYTGYIQVTWNAVGGASAYDVYRNTSNNSASATLLGERTSPFNDTGVTPGTRYYYWVKAKNSCGNISDFSASDSGYACPVPPIPTGVSATDGTYTCYIQVTWNRVSQDTAVSHIASYEVYRSTNSNSGTATKVGDVPDSPSPSFNDFSVTPGILYYYWVKAKNSCGNISGFSSSDSGYACPIPSAPTGVSASDEEYTDHIHITWTQVVQNTAVSNVSSYKIYRYDSDNAGLAEEIAEVEDSPTPSYDDFDVVPRTTYYYWVQTINSCNAESALSDSDSGYVYTEDLTITKATVKAGKSAYRDYITISGKMHATADDLRNADFIWVTVDSEDMVYPCNKFFPINRNSLKVSKGVYKFNFSGYESWLSISKKVFTYNLKTGKFTVTAKNTDLSGMSCPVSLRIQIGGYIGKAELNEPIVNGKKTIPRALMLRIQ
jgi:hypothetical protein